MSKRDRTAAEADIEAVITSYNQGSMILEAVRSVCNQTLLPKRISRRIIMDAHVWSPRCGCLPEWWKYRLFFVS